MTLYYYVSHNEMLGTLHHTLFTTKNTSVMSNRERFSQLVTKLQQYRSELGVTPTKKAYCARYGLSDYYVQTYGPYRELKRAAGCLLEQEVAKDYGDMLRSILRAFEDKRPAQAPTWSGLNRAADAGQNTLRKHSGYSKDAVKQHLIQAALAYDPNWPSHPWRYGPWLLSVGIAWHEDLAWDITSQERYEVLEGTITWQYKPYSVRRDRSERKNVKIHTRTMKWIY